jgi:hypothetical protein
MSSEPEPNMVHTHLTIVIKLVISAGVEVTVCPPAFVVTITTVDWNVDLSTPMKAASLE